MNGKRLRILLIERDKTLRDVHRATGIPYYRLIRLVNDYCLPSSAEIELIAGFLGVAPRELRSREVPEFRNLEAGAPPMKTQRETGRLLAARRVELGLTQIEVAQRAKVSADYVSDLECGRRIPGPELLQRLIDILGIPEDASGCTP